MLPPTFLFLILHISLTPPLIFLSFCLLYLWPDNTWTLCVLSSVFLWNCQTVNTSHPTSSQWKSSADIHSLPSYPSSAVANYPSIHHFIYPSINQFIYLHYSASGVMRKYEDSRDSLYAPSTKIATELWCVSTVLYCIALCILGFLWGVSVERVLIMWISLNLSLDFFIPIL